MKLKAYAEAHYNEGWDTFVETYEDEELEEFVEGLESWAEVLEMAEKLVSVWEDRRADAAHEIHDLGGY